MPTMEAFMNDPFQFCWLDTLALMNGKRMIRRLELDGRANRVRTKVNIRLEQKRVWIARNSIAQPAEIWAHVRNVSPVVQLKIPLIVRLAQRDPDTPYELVRLTPNGHLKAAAHEKVLAVDGASVARERSPRGALRFGYLFIVERRAERKVAYCFERLPASRAPFLGHIQLSRPMRANAPGKVRQASADASPR